MEILDNLKSEWSMLEPWERILLLLVAIGIGLWFYGGFRF